MTTARNASPPSPFKDHFSGHASSYAEYRPTYPEALFAFLADCCERHDLAWDCATGNGQAALALTRYFDRVIASDASEAQIAKAEPHPDLVYRVARAEESGLDDKSVDLITVAQAAHWFDVPAFCDEAHRVLVPGGVLAIWSYANCQVSPECDKVINELYADIVGPYWLPEREIVEGGYESIELPMPLIHPPKIGMKIEWEPETMLGYLRTWSASQLYLKDRGDDPVALIESKLRRVWGDGRREVTWPLNIKIGRV